MPCIKVPQDILCKCVQLHQSSHKTSHLLTFVYLGVLFMNVKYELNTQYTCTHRHIPHFHTHARTHTHTQLHSHTSTHTHMHVLSLDHIYFMTVPIAMCVCVFECHCVSVCVCMYVCVCVCDACIEVPTRPSLKVQVMIDL